MAQSLERAENEPLQVIVTTVGDNVTRVFIVGDTAAIEVPKTDILSATLLLFVSYYVFDQAYHRCYAIF